MLGNQFIINCKLGIAHKPIQHLDETIDYAMVLQIIKERFSVKTDLLEKIISDCEAMLKEQFPQILYLYLSIKKCNPPLSPKVESSEVIVEKSYTI